MMGGASTNARMSTCTSVAAGAAVEAARAAPVSAPRLLPLTWWL